MTENRLNRGAMALIAGLVLGLHGALLAEEVFQTKVAGDRFRFAIFADPQVSAENNKGKVSVNAQETTAQIAEELKALQQRPAFAVWLGDIVNVFEPESVANFRRLSRLFAMPQALVHGNHDTLPPYDAYRQLQKEVSGVEAPFYSFNAGRWHFIVTPCNLQGNGAEQQKTEQELLKWLEADLALNRDRPTLVFNHLHFMPQGLSQTEFYQQPLALRKKMLELMTRHGNVKYYFNGHVHNGIQTAEKTAWGYKGIRFFTVPTIIQPRPYGEEYPAFERGIERGGYYLLVDVDGDTLTPRGRLAGSDAEYLFPESMFKPFDEQKNPLWFHSLPELAAKPLLENGDFSKGFTGWTLPDRYHRESDPFFVATTDKAGATFKVKTPVESLWADDEYLQASQVVSCAPGQSPVLRGRYRLTDMPKAGGGYVSALLLNDTELKALMMFRWSAQEARCNYLPRCLGYQLTGRQVNWMFFQELGKKKQGMFWTLPSTTDQWHTFTFNLEELYDATHTAGDFQRLGVTKIQLAVGVWNQNNLPGMASEARFAELALTHTGGLSMVDNHPLPVDPSIFSCQFGQRLTDSLRNKTEKPAPEQYRTETDDPVAREFAGLYQDIERRTSTPTAFRRGIYDLATREKQASHSAANLLETDRDPVDVVLRRTQALWDDLHTKTDLERAGERLVSLEKTNLSISTNNIRARLELFREAVSLRRSITFANPLLRGLDRILFITRCPLPLSTVDGGNHMCDQFFGFHGTRQGRSTGDGLYVLENPFSEKPAVRNLLKGVKVQNGRLKGQELAGGGFLSPELSYDGKTILFAWTQAKRDEKKWRVWMPETTYHIFKVNADGSNLVQLTDGAWNDFDPCWLPNGRIIFISERRGGYGRCHGRPVPNYTLHSMLDDGSDIVLLSPHETNEWQPSVDNNGMVVYTRWDYVDRGASQAHHAWLTTPDGRDPRALNGNTHASRTTAPDMQMDIRSIPGSPLYVAVAAAHHGEARGSLLLIDPRLADDDHMSQLKRLTPDQLFPEAEFWRVLPSGSYATPWPLSETYHLCVYDREANNQYAPIDEAARNYGLVLLDAFGNKELLYRNPEISCLSPIPFRPRQRPPVLPHGTLLGRPPAAAGAPAAVASPAELPRIAKVGCINVYDSRHPFPPGSKITHLRIWQVLPKTTPHNNRPRMGMGSEKGTKAALGTVPVEEDGSAYWEQPVGVPILFHALDANGLAVQGMRSATYVKPGEELMCNGCHDQRTAAPMRNSTPQAMSRPASRITPDSDGSNPFNYPRLVQPVLDSKCVSCHTANRAKGGKAPDLSRGENKKDRDLFYTSFNSLKPFCFFYDNAGFTESYTVPGRFGARESKLYKLLSEGHHKVKLTSEEMRRLTLWLDSNGLFYGHEDNIKAQADGEIVLPSLQ